MDDDDHVLLLVCLGVDTGGEWRGTPCPGPDAERHWQLDAAGNWLETDAAGKPLAGQSAPAGAPE